jgi:hypothetical protein
VGWLPSDGPDPTAGAAASIRDICTPPPIDLLAVRSRLGLGLELAAATTTTTTTRAMAGRACTRRLAAAVANILTPKSTPRATSSALSTTPVRHFFLVARHSLPVSRPAIQSAISRPTQSAVKVHVRNLSSLTAEQIAEVKELVRAEVLAELRAGGFKELMEEVKVVVRAEVLPVDEKFLARHTALTDDFTTFKLAEVTRVSDMKKMHTEALVKVGTVAWRVCNGVLALTVLILFEFYDVVKVGWQASVLDTAKKHIQEKAQEIEDRLTDKLKLMLDQELKLLCAKYFLKQSKAADDSAASSN